MKSNIYNIQSALKLVEKENEDLELLDTIDEFFKKRRGFVVKMPKSGVQVTACMSGGGDSITNIAILLEEFGLEVYPFFIDRGQSNYIYEKKSVNYFNSFFKKRYPKLYHDVIEIKVETPGKVYKKLLTDSLTGNHVSYPSRNSVIFLTGAEYAYSLKQKGIFIKTMFASHLSSDSSFHCSLTWHRLTNLTMCQIMNDYEWQFISIPIEREFGNFYDKDVYVKYCEKHGIPLEETRTCVKDTDIQCGKCPCCWDRRRCFQEAGIQDKTEYLYAMPDHQPITFDY